VTRLAGLAGPAVWGDAELAGPAVRGDAGSARVEAPTAAWPTAALSRAAGIRSPGRRPGLREIAEWREAYG
jgi:hypothetical protein